MKKSLFFIVLMQIFLNLVIDICPNNCSGHGKCVNNVCECEKSVGVLSSGGSFESLSWIGADCSKKSCGVDYSFSVIVSDNAYENRLVDDGVLPIRELFEDVIDRKLKSEISVSSVVRISDTSFYEVTMDNSENVFANKIGGLLYYYNENNEYLGKCEIFCKSNDKSKCFMKFEQIDVEYNPELYSYIIILEYSDYSLIYDKSSTTDKSTYYFVWKKMGYIINKLGITSQCYFECDGDENPVVFTISAVNDATPTDPQNVKFTSQAEKTSCSLLGVDITTPSEITKKEGVKVTEVTGAILKLEGKNMQIYKIEDAKSYLTIPSNKIGVLECITPFSTSSKAYLMNVITSSSSSKTYYISYDFTLSKEHTPNPTEYKCEKLIEYNDLSYYFPSDLDTTGSKCEITWSGMKDVISDQSPTSLIQKPTDDSTFSFACKNDKDIVRIYNGFTYSLPIPGGEITFTKSDCDIPKGKYTCFILAEIKNNKITPLDSISNSYLEKNHLTISKSTGILTYKAVKQIADNKIYEMSGSKYNIGPSGGTLECYKSDGSKYEGKIVRKKGEIITVKTSEAMTEDSYDIRKMKIKHSDLSLYNPVSPINEGKTISWSDIYDYLDGTNFLNNKNDKYQFACKKDNENTIHIRDTKRTITTEKENKLEFSCDECETDETCYILSYSDGSRIKDIFESDLMKIFNLNKNNDGIYTHTPNKITFIDSGKTITTPITGDAKNIYEMSGVKYEIGKSGGLLSCFKKDDTFVTEVEIIGIKDENIYYVTSSVVLTDPDTGIDHCNLIMKMNDLSTQRELTLSCGDGSPCTLSYPKLELKLFDNQFISLKKTSSKFICGVKTKGNAFAIYDFTLTKEDPLTFSIEKEGSLATGDVCYLASDVDGKDIEISNSDIFKLQLEGSDYKYINKDVKITSDDNKFIYKVKGVNYDVGKSGGKIICKTSSSTTIATIIGKMNDIYYIDYGLDKNGVNLRGCKLIQKYNDFSLLQFTQSSLSFSTTYITSTINSLDFICNKKEGNKHILSKKSGTVTTNTPVVDNVYTFTVSFTPDVSAVDETCSMLYGEKGEIELKDSDYRNEYLIDNPSEWKYNINGIIDEEVKTVNVNEISSLKSIINEIPEIGGTLKCYDSSGKELGRAIVYSNLNGEINIEYKFAMKNMFDDNNKEILNEMKFEVISKNEDLSINSIEVKEDNCKNENNCELIWKGVGLLLISKGFFDDFENTKSSSLSSSSSLMRLLSPTYIELCCANGVDGSISNITFLSEIVGNDVILSDPKPITPSAGSECFALLNSECKSMDISESVLGKSVIIDEEGKMILPSVIKKEDGSGVSLTEDEIKSGKISKISKNTKNENVITTYPYDVVDIGKKMDSLEMLLISPIEDQELFNEIKQYLSIGSWISILKSAESTIYQSQILKIDYNLEISYSYNDGSRRMRELADTYTNTFWGLKLSNFNDIKCDIIGGNKCFYTISGSSINSIHKRVECSGQGVCNRESGLCECFIGFSGSYCQRLDCPSNCNGNGRCVGLKELLLNEELKNYNNDIDNGRVYGCLCDKRHRGYDCSLIECPSGVDPEGVSNIDGLEYRDCSGRGICNYESGVCECFDGFSGEGCQYQSQTM